MILPVYKNRQHLPELLSRLTATLEASGAAWEIVCVDDCGGDGSYEWIERRASVDARIRLVANRVNRGQHASVLAGLRAAVGHRLVVMDADLQDAPEDIPRLLGCLETGASAVFARRAGNAAEAGLWTGRWFKRVLHAVAGSRVPPGTGMFLVLRREVCDAIARAASDRPYLPLLIGNTGCRLGVVDVVRHRRSRGRSAYTSARRLTAGARALTQAVQHRLRRR